MVRFQEPKDGRNRCYVDNHIPHRPIDNDTRGKGKHLEDKSLGLEVSSSLVKVHKDNDHSDHQDRDLATELRSPIYKIYKSFERQFKFTAIIGRVAAIA